MRLTAKLCQQHLGWTFKKHWQVQGKRVVRDTGAAAELEKLGIVVKDVNDILNPKKPVERINIVGNKPVILAEDETHPNWHSKACITYGDNDLLLEGLQQAQILTKTIVVNEFPKNVEEAVVRLRLPTNIDRNVQSLIMESLVYDAEQVKLPKVKLVDRPAYNLPRVYGISHERRLRLLVNKLLGECEKWTSRAATAERRLIDNLNFKVTIPKEGDLLQFGITVEKLIATKRALEPVKAQYQGDLPDLYPIKGTISMPKKNIYTTELLNPLVDAMKYTHPHTIITNFLPEKVRNLHGTAVTPSQWESRTLLKAFAVAAARSKQLYGNIENGKLPKPVLVQSVQTDGRVFHFGVFQLNTLQLEGSDGLKNYWFHQPQMELYGECGYKAGRPKLDSYNKDVFRLFNAFYNS